MPSRLQQPRFTLRYLPELDGVRAIAIIGVLVAHYNLTEHFQAGTRGGILGVDVFFVLSGFLITSLLVEEIVTTDRLSLGVFYARRALRLFPALFAMVAITAIAVVTSNRLSASASSISSHSLLREVVPVLTYWDNWYRAFALGPPTPVSHAWSLSIEEQFYLVWPVAIFALLRWGGFRLALWFAVGGAVASCVARAVQYRSVASYGHVYFSTHTRASDLLFGCALALLRAGRRAGLPAAARARVARPALAICLVHLTYLGRIETSYLYRWGFTIFGIATTVVLANLVVGRVPFAQPGALVVLVVYVGQISYGLYLWLRPVQWFVQSEFSPHATMAVGLPLTFMLAATSRVVVERPFLRLKSRIATRRVDSTVHAAAQTVR